MAPSLRKPPARQPLRSHFRAAKRSVPAVKGETVEPAVKHSGGDVAARKQDQTSNEGKVRALSSSSSSTSPLESTKIDGVSSSSAVMPSLPVRPSTPPPRNESASATPHSPPRTPVPRTRTATLPEYDLLEPEQRSPVSVRTDPETGKMYLMLPSPSTSHTLAQALQRTNDDGESVLRHKRLRQEGANDLSTGAIIGSARSSPILNDVDDGNDDDLTITETPKAIRERATGATLSELSTPNKTATFALARSVVPKQHDAQLRRLKRRRRSESPEKDEQHNPFLGAELQSAVTRPSSLYIHPIDTKHASPAVRGSRTLPLPTHHATLYALHAALEHALVVHLATMGTAGSTIEEMVETVNKSGGGAGSRSVLAIPELITLSALRPLVERSSGRRFGMQELARLLWVWNAYETDGDESKNKSFRRQSNVGLTITRTRTLDKAGKRVQDYSLGIRLYTDTGDDSDYDEDESGEEGETAATASKTTGDVNATLSGKHIARPRTPPRASAQRRALAMGGEPQSPSPSPRITNTPGRMLPDSPSMSRTLRATAGQHHIASPLLSSPSSSLYARRGISLVALWNNGMERRKRAVRQRLLRWCLSCFAAWKQERADGDLPSLTSPRASFHDRSPAVARQTGLGIVHEDHFPDEHADRAAASVRTPRPTNFPDGMKEGQGGLITPSSTREEGHVPGAKRFKDHFGIAAMGSTPSYVLDWDTDFPLERVAPIPMAAMPSLDEPISITQASPSSSSSIAVSASSPQVSRLEAARTAHRNAIAQSEETLGRKLTLAERIRAKEEAAAARTGSGIVGNGENVSAVPAALTSAQAVAVAARKRSSLSRLQSVAESIFMLFVSSSSSSVGSGSLRFTPLPLHDVLKAICNASRTAMSAVDAQSCLDQLQIVAPGFVEVDSVGARRWVRLVGHVDEQGHDGGSTEGTAVSASTSDNTAPSSSSSSMLAAVRRCVRAELQRMEASGA